MVSSVATLPIIFFCKRMGLPLVKKNFTSLEQNSNLLLFVCLDLLPYLQQLLISLIAIFFSILKNYFI